MSSILDPIAALVARSLAMEWPPLGLGFREMALGRATRSLADY